MQTSGGKTINISLIPGSILYKISFQEGGELPEELKGTFTDPLAAEIAALVYLDKQKPKKAA